MYYQNGNYMQDLNYYNQNPSYGFNPYSQNNYAFQNMNTQMNRQQNVMQMPQYQNISAMYPAVYRIISPVVSQVLCNTNTGYLTEESLNNLVDTVYNTVEGDINLADYSNVSTTTTSNETNSGSNATRCANNTNSNTTVSTVSTSNKPNALLRDLIKIMILTDIISRRQNQTVTMSNNIPNANMNQPLFM